MMSKEEFENYFKEDGTFLNRLKRYLKQNLGINNAFEKMCKLICQCDFVDLGRANELIDWNVAEVVEL